MNVVVINDSFMEPTSKLLVCRNVTPDQIYICQNVTPGLIYYRNMTPDLVYVLKCDTQSNICFGT